MCKSICGWCGQWVRLAVCLQWALFVTTGMVRAQIGAQTAVQREGLQREEDTDEEQTIDQTRSTLRFEREVLRALREGEPTADEYASYLKVDSSRIAATHDHPSSAGMAVIRRLKQLPSEELTQTVLPALEKQLLASLDEPFDSETVFLRGQWLNLINALSALGPEAHPILKNALGHHPTLDLMLTRKLGTEAKSRLRELLLYPEDDWYWLGFYAAMQAKPGREWIPELLNAVKENDGDNSNYIRMILAGIGPDGVAQVAEAMSDPDWFARFSAARTFEMIGPKAAAALPLLEERLNDGREDMDVRIAAARAIARITQVDAKVLYSTISDYERKLIDTANAKSLDWRRAYLNREGNQPFDTEDRIGWAQSAWVVAAMSSGQNLAKANDVLLNWLNTRDEFGSTDSNCIWIFMTCYSKARKNPGRLNPETEEAYKEFCFRLLNRPARTKPITLDTRYLNDAISNKNLMSLNDDLPLDETIRDYLILSVLKDDPKYRGQQLLAGDLVEDRFDAFNRYFKAALRQWALYGLQYQIGSSAYAYKTYPHYFNLMELAPDPEVRKLAKMFTDVVMVESAQISISDLRGGSKGRAKRGGLGDRWDPYQALLYGERGSAYFLTMPADSSYLPPEPAIRLRKFGKPIASYEIVNDRPTGVGDNDSGFLKSCSALNYAWVTPEYVTGCGMYDPNMPRANGAMGRWSGVIFRNLAAISLDAYTGEKWSVQHKDVRITQQCSDGPYTPGNTCLIFEALAGKVSERDDWIFVDNDESYAAVKIVEGGYFWMDTLRRSLFTNNPYSPIVIQTGRQADYPTFDAFQSAILNAHLSYRNQHLVYSGPNSAELSFQAMTPARLKAGEKYRLPKVDGNTIDLDPEYAYQSPYLKNKAGSQMIELTYDDRTWVYDFETATITGPQ